MKQITNQTYLVWISVENKEVSKDTENQMKEQLVNKFPNVQHRFIINQYKPKQKINLQELLEQVAEQINSKDDATEGLD